MKKKNIVWFREYIKFSKFLKNLNANLELKMTVISNCLWNRLIYKFSMIDLLQIKITVYVNMSMAFADAIVAITLDTSCFAV